MSTTPDTVPTRAQALALANRFRFGNPFALMTTAALAAWLEAVADQLRDTERLDAAQRLMVNMEVSENVAGNIERRLVALSRENLDRLIAEAGR